MSCDYVTTSSVYVDVHEKKENNYSTILFF